MGMPLLSSESRVQELGSGAVDAERVEHRGGGRGNRLREFEALATAPVELVAELPAEYQPGTPVLMHGPHGPVEVMPPMGVVPGSQMCYRLAPEPEFRVEVPLGSGPGSQVQFERSDGVEVSVTVPPGLRPGEIFDVTPPSLMVRVPEGAAPGDRVIFRHSIGIGPGGREETEWCRSQIPGNLRPGQYFAVRLPAPPGMKPLERSSFAPKSDLLGTSACTFVERANELEEI